MRCLSLTQPWASLVAWGEKRIETRSWYTPYRGPIAIHAAKHSPRWASDLCDDEPFRSALLQHGVSHGIADLPKGAVIAVCRLVTCLPTGPARLPSPRIPAPGTAERTFGDYSAHRYMWFLADVEMLPDPVPAVGHLGLWEWPAPAEMRTAALVGAWQ